MAKLTSLTDDQKAQMAPWADAWIARALDPTPADEALVELGMMECYEAAGLVWHGNIVWVDSPLTVAFAGPQDRRPRQSGDRAGCPHDRERWLLADRFVAGADRLADLVVVERLVEAPLDDLVAVLVDLGPLLGGE